MSVRHVVELSKQKLSWDSTQQITMRDGIVFHGDVWNE